METPSTQHTRYVRFRKLTEVSRALTYAVSLDDVLHLTVAHAAELLGTDKALLMMTDGDGLLSVRASVGVDAASCERFAEPLDETLVVRLRNLLQVDASHFLGVPLVVGGNVTGILAVAVPTDEASSDEHEWLLSALADQASVALEKTKLDESIEFREKLIGIVSHDLRTPITAIVISCRSLMKHGGMEPQAAATVGRINACAQRATRMIHDLLDYTQAHLGGGIRLQKRLIGMDGVVKNAVTELGIANPERVIEVETNTAAVGDWDADRLGQVVRNLLSNALHYSPADTPIKIVIDHAPEGGVLLSFHNHGPPIEKNRLIRIFEPMQRATAINAASERSVGLGLYIVKHIVEAHGGTVSVQSDAALGTSFTVRLPP